MAKGNVSSSSLYNPTSTFQLTMLHLLGHYRTSLFYMPLSLHHDNYNAAFSKFLSTTFNIHDVSLQV